MLFVVRDILRRQRFIGKQCVGYVLTLMFTMELSVKLLVLTELGSIGPSVLCHHCASFLERHSNLDTVCGLVFVL